MMMMMITTAATGKQRKLSPIRKTAEKRFS